METLEIDKHTVLYIAAGFARKTMTTIKENNHIYERSSDLNVERCTSIKINSSPKCLFSYSLSFQERITLSIFY